MPRPCTYTADVEHPRALSIAALILTAAALCAGCASQPPAATFEVPAGAYANAFQSAKDALRDAAFELDRVDARDGVIVTAPRQWAGIATPWIPHSTGMRSSMEGLAHHERRYARVVFEPIGGASSEHGTDLREYDGKMNATVEVVVQRIYRPGRRVSPAGIRLTSTAVDPSLIERGMQPQFIEDQGQDAELAGRLAAKMAGAKNTHVEGDAAPKTAAHESKP